MNGECAVIVTLTDLSTDLDLFLLSPSGAASCSTYVAGTGRPGDAEECSTTPIDIQQRERVTFDAAAGQAYVVVVDSYDEADGTYTIAVDCTCGP